MLATYVIETVGTAGVRARPGRLPRAVRGGVRRGRGRRRGAEPAVPAARRPARAAAVALGARRRDRQAGGGPGRGRCRPRARHPAAGLPARAVPDGAGASRRPSDRLVVARPARHPAAGPAARVALAAALAAAASRSGSTRRSTGWSPAARRPDREGRWITPSIARAYGELHRLGWAHSVECWADDELAGGLYGVAIGGLFAGESMFSAAPRCLEGRAGRPGRPAGRGRARRPGRRSRRGCSTSSGAPTTWPRWGWSRCRGRSTWPGSARPCAAASGRPRRLPGRRRSRTRSVVGSARSEPAGRGGAPNLARGRPLPGSRVVSGVGLRPSSAVSVEGAIRALRLADPAPRHRGDRGSSGMHLPAQRLLQRALPRLPAEGGHRERQAGHGPLERLLDRRARRRGPGVGPDPLVRRGLPAQEGRPRVPGAAALQRADRDPLHRRAALHDRRALLLHRPRRDGPAVDQRRSPTWW